MSFRVIQRCILKFFSVCFSILFACPAITAQVNVDSLKSLVATATSDSVKGRLLLDISRSIRGYTEESEAYARQAMELGRNIYDRLLESDARYRLAWHAYAQSELQEGNAMLDSALSYYISTNDEANMAKCYNLQAVIMADFGDFNKAKTRYEQALDIYQKLNNKRSEAAVLNNLGSLLSGHGYHEEAIGLHERALQIYDILGIDPDGVARQYYNIGIAKEGQQKIIEALHYHVLAHEMRKKEQILPGVAESLIRISDLLNDSILISKDTRLASLDTLGYASQDIMLDSAFSISNRLQNPGFVANVYQARINRAQSLGDYKQAFEFQSLYHALLDSTRLDKAHLGAMVNLQTRLENEQQKNQILLLENEKQIETLLTQKRQRERNALGALALLLISIGGLGYLVLRQRLKARSLALELKNQQLKEQEQRAQINTMNAMLQGQEKERDRIARDLHDGVGNMLTTIKMQLNSLKDANGTLHETSQLVNDTHAEVRRISHHMMPVSLQKLGLSKAVEELCRKNNQGNGTQFHFETFGELPRMDAEREVMIYRICEELIQNATKHAQAKNVIVQFSTEDRALTITVEDDGIGITPQLSNESQGLGLKSIETRLKFLHGTWTLDSRPGIGTTIQMEIPLNHSTPA